MNNKAICYVRVSTEEQVKEGVSLQSQEEKLLAYCRMIGLETTAVIKEEGVSASKKLSSRPGGLELLNSVTRKRVSHIIALKLDRLFRDAEDALHQTKEWDKSGIALHLVDMGGQTINTASAMGRFFLGMMAGFAELERNLIAERTTTALNFMKNNKQVYGPIPFGFDRQGEVLIENNNERATVEKIIEQRIGGLSFAKIAEWLNSQGIASKNGGKWYASTVHYIFKNNIHREVA